MSNKSWLRNLALAFLPFSLASPLVALEPFTTLEAPTVPFPYNPVAFWASVAISDDFIVVGAPVDDYPDGTSGRGAAFAFHWNGQGWTREAKLVGSQAGLYDLFGSSVAMQNDVLVVGERHTDPVSAVPGQAFVFRRVGGTWTEETILLPSISASGDHFGRCVDIDNQRIVVAAPGTGTTLDPPTIPRLFVFRWTGSAWVEDAALTPSDAEVNEDTATVVAIRGDDILVGAPLDDAPLEDSGSVYPFH